MKKILISLLILLSINLYAKEYESPLSEYKQNYFITGDQEDQVKFQFSMKFNLLWPFESGIYFGYTQLSYWRLYDLSEPFVDNNYQPEVFYQFDSGDNLFYDISLPFIDYIKIAPYYHRSNGREEGDYNRGEDKYYGEIQASYGDVYNFGARVKVFDYYNLSEENSDINKYHKNYEAGVFFKLRSKEVEHLDKEEIFVSWGGNPINNGWIQVELSTRIITTYIQPKLYLQIYSGYDEFMLNYNKRTEAIRIGLIF